MVIVGTGKVSQNLDLAPEPTPSSCPPPSRVGQTEYRDTSSQVKLEFRSLIDKTMFWIMCVVKRRLLGIKNIQRGGCVWAT